MRLNVVGILLLSSSVVHAAGGGDGHGHGHISDLIYPAINAIIFFGFII